LGGRGRQFSEFKASLVYRVSSRTARATQRNPASKTKTKTKNKTKKPLKKQDINKPNNHITKWGTDINRKFSIEESQMA
jgi:hypothetical protein